MKNGQKNTHIPYGLQRKLFTQVSPCIRLMPFMKGGQLYTEKYCKHLILILYLHTLLGSVCNNGRWMRWQEITHNCHCTMSCKVRSVWVHLWPSLLYIRLHLNSQAAFSSGTASPSMGARQSPSLVRKEQKNPSLSFHHKFPKDSVLCDYYGTNEPSGVQCNNLVIYVLNLCNSGFMHKVLQSNSQWIDAQTRTWVDSQTQVWEHIRKVTQVLEA